jgi:hypothetical protein
MTNKIENAALATEDVYDIPYSDHESDPEIIINNLHIDKKYLNEIKIEISNINQKINNLNNENNENNKKNFNDILNSIKLITKNISIYYGTINSIINAPKNNNLKGIITNNINYDNESLIICLEYFENMINELQDKFNSSEIQNNKIYLYLFNPNNKPLIELLEKIKNLKKTIIENTIIENKNVGGKKNKKTKRRLKNKKTKKNVKKSRKTKTRFRR